ncbi:hypothetical protein [Bacillus sp. FJAT-27251]
MIVWSRNGFWVIII